MEDNNDNEDENVEEDEERDELDMREARLVMQVELLSHLLRTISTEILQIPPKPVKNKIDHSNLKLNESAECHYGFFSLFSLVLF